MAKTRAPLPQLGPLFDSHCHLTWPVKEDTTEARIARAREAGIAKMISVAVDLPTAEDARQLAQQHPDIFPTVGIHPTDVPHGEQLNQDLQALRELAKEDDWVAIGESGLDLFHQRSDLQDQQRSLEMHLELSAQHQLPIILHCRDAIDELLPVLRAAGSVQGVMHCYSEAAAPVEELLHLGLHISFAGNLTYPKSEQLRQAAQEVPMDRILVETDAPFLAPQARRGKRNEPAFVAFTAAFLAELKGLSGEDLAAQTFANGCRLFGVPAEV